MTYIEQKLLPQSLFEVKTAEGGRKDLPMDYRNIERNIRKYLINNSETLKSSGL